MNEAVERYIDALPEEVRELAWRLHYTMLDAAPGMRPVLKYGAPFYEYHGILAYLSYSKHGLEISYTKGFALDGPPELLIKRDRKMVKSVAVPDESALESEFFHDTLQQALLVNENWKKNKAHKR